MRAGMKKLAFANPPAEAVTAPSTSPQHPSSRAAAFQATNRLLMGLTASVRNVEAPFVKNLLGLLLGLAIVIGGIPFIPYLQAMGDNGPFALLAILWITLFALGTIGGPPPRPNIKFGLGFSIAVCLPVLAVLVNRWLGYAVGVIVVLAVGWILQKIKPEKANDR